MHYITMHGGSGSFASCGVSHALAGEPLLLGAPSALWANREPSIEAPAPGLVLSLSASLGERGCPCLPSVGAGRGWLASSSREFDCRFKLQIRWAIYILQFRREPKVSNYTIT